MKFTYLSLDQMAKENDPFQSDMPFNDISKWLDELMVHQAMNNQKPPVVMVHLKPKSSVRDKYFSLTDTPKEDTFITITHNSLSYIKRVASKIQRDIAEIWCYEYESYQDAFENSIDFYEVSKHCYSKG